MKLTDTQLVLLSAASRRDDRALERPSKLTGGAAGKVVAKLLAEGAVTALAFALAVLIGEVIESWLPGEGTASWLAE